MHLRGESSQYNQTIGRSFADSPMGSISPGDCVTHGSEGPMTRARWRRRLIAGSSERSGTNSEASGQDLVASPQEWRDWANLTCDLVEDIAGRLLSHDVAEYYSFRAVCTPWREHSADLRARGPLDRRFRPRNWAVLTITPDAGPRRLLLNITTGASITTTLPALTTHCHLGAVDGFLILFHKFTMVISLLDPLSNAVTEFPALRASSLDLTKALFHFYKIFQKSDSVRVYGINGACLDDSTSPPTLVLCLRYNQSCIVVAKPGDTHWKLVNQGRVYYSETMGTLVVSSSLSHGGRCYVASLEGSIFQLELGLLPPRLVEIISQKQHATKDAIAYWRIASFLLADTTSSGRMLMVRYWFNIKHFGGRTAFNRNQHQHVFTVDGVTGCIEVSEVDVAGRTLVPLSSLGGEHAAFVGLTHCMLVSNKIFPSIAADAIYLGYRSQFYQKLSVYHLKTRRTEPPHDFAVDEEMRVVPCARPCSLDQYLVAYVDCKHRVVSCELCYSYAQK